MEGSQMMPALGLLLAEPPTFSPMIRTMSSSRNGLGSQPAPAAQGSRAPHELNLLTPYTVRVGVRVTWSGLTRGTPVLSAARQRGSTPYTALAQHTGHHVISLTVKSCRHALVPGDLKRVRGHRHHLGGAAWVAGLELAQGLHASLRQWRGDRGGHAATRTAEASARPEAAHHDRHVKVHQYEVEGVSPAVGVDCAQCLLAVICSLNFVLAKPPQDSERHLRNTASLGWNFAHKQ
eukprot:361277-Chlamydomonas_euryale.AAC.5